MSVTQDKLIEKVARAISDESGNNYSDDELYYWESEARAAIRVVLEEAAKVADDEWYHGTPAIEFSKAIRALIPGEGDA